MKKTLLQAALIVALSIMAAAATWLIMGPPADEAACDPASLKPGEICLSDIPAAMQVLWVDSRSRSDWQRNGIAGSILWNLDTAEDMNAFEAEAVMRILNTPYVVVYCDSRHCGTSHQVAKRIRDLDLGAQVHVLHGGWQALKAAGKIPVAAK